MKSYTVVAVLGGREVRASGITVEGSGRQRAVVSYNGVGELVHYPLKGRKVAAVVLEVGLADLRSDFKGKLTGTPQVLCNGMEIAAVRQVLAEIPTADLFQAAREVLHA